MEKESCIINIELETENDVYFGITNTILSYDKKKRFTINDIIKELKETYNWGQEIFNKWNIRSMVKISLKKLIELGRVIEEPRCYELYKSKLKS